MIRLYETGARSLYNLAEDPGERRDLASRLLEKVRELDQRLTDYLAAVGAQMPQPNPDADTSVPARKPGGGQRRGKP